MNCALPPPDPTNLLIPIAALLLAVPRPATAGDPTEPARFRTIRGTVLRVDGRPAAARDVYLVGLSRSAVGTPDEGEKADGNRSFQTDADGRFTARIGDFDSWSDPRHRPGWGEYALVVEPAGRDAGVVSPRLICTPTPPGEPSSDLDEWGAPELLPPAGLDLVLKIQSGVTLHGRIMDYTLPTCPLARIRVRAGSDLHADTHTGYGGEIFDQETTTGATGAFSFEHLFPTRFYLSLGGGELAARSPSAPDPAWLKTKIDGRWIEDAINGLTPAAGQTEMRIEIAAAPEPLFEYRGRVADADGRPIAGAEVAFGISYHREPQTFADSHSYQSTTTQADGRNAIRLPTPWVRGMAAEKTGFARQDRWAEDDRASFAPGEYDFTLPPAAP